MRFLMLNWRDPGNPLAGGAERVSLGYLAALAERGHEVYWFANAFPGCSSTNDYEGVRVVRGGGVGTSILAARRWVRRQASFDLIIDQHHGLPWFAPWWGGTRTVAYIHEVLGPIWQSFYGWPWSRLGEFVERNLIRWYRSTPFWSACPSTETALRKLGVKEVELIPYGVSTRPLDPLPEKRITGPVRLAVVSRLAPNKRIEHAIDGVAELRSRGVEVRLSIVGDGEVRPFLEERVQTRGVADIVQFVGRLGEGEKDQLLADSHLLLHTSVREGWGLNVIEANCMGTPSVVYPVPGLIESTLHEQTGIVVAEESPAALADGVERFIADPALYESCRQSAVRRGAEFHWDQVTSRACDWLELLARGCA
jgi:glycosyltransferase involved in cell wall biosynthesis